MKKVIQNQETETINLSNITNDMIVGIKWRNNEKSYLIQQKDNTYIGMNASFTAMGKYSHNSKKEYCINSIKFQQATVFVFDTAKELYKWLSK